MLYKKWQRYSYTAQRHQRHRILVALSWLIGVFLLYLCFTSYLVFSFYVESDSMGKTLLPGDVGFALATRLFPKDETSSFFPYERGNLVILEKTFTTEPYPWYARLWDNLFDFFTAHRVAGSNGNRRLFIKRIIALPGDEISIQNHIVRVKPAQQGYSLTEFELSAAPYDIQIPETGTDKGSSLPFSATMEPFRLKEGECFVLSDDRGDCNDSRTWGPVLLSDIKGKPFFRYWPFSRFGRL